MEFKKGYFGFLAPTALRALMTEVVADCSMYPSMGRDVTATGCLGGGSLAGRLFTS